MNIFLTIERVLWVVSLVVQASIVARIVSNRLFSRYGWFATYLAVETLSSLFLIHLGVNSRHYAEAYRYAEIVFLVLRAGVACELWERICDHFPGVGYWRFALAGIFVSIGTTAACFTYWPDLCAQWGFPQTVAIIIKRLEGEIYPLVFLMMWLFLRHVVDNQRPFRPNTDRHWKLLMVYFANSGIASLLVLWMGGGRKVFPINSAMLGIDLVCLSIWLWRVDRQGEQLPAFDAMSTAEITLSRLRHRDLMKTVRWLPGAIAARIKDHQAND